MKCGYTEVATKCAPYSFESEDFEYPMSQPSTPTIIIRILALTVTRIRAVQVIDRSSGYDDMHRIHGYLVNPIRQTRSIVRQGRLATILQCAEA